MQCRPIGLSKTEYLKFPSSPPKQESQNPPSVSLQRTMQETRGLAGGFFIGRVLSPGSAAEAAGLKRVRRLSAVANKENITRPGSEHHRKSLLPSWYPRTPLRDITALVNALELRRARIQAARAQQTSIHPEVSTQISVLARPSPQEQTPSSIPTAGISTPSQTRYQLQTSDSADLIHTGSKPTEPCQLCSSMHEIEKAAKDYLRKTSKEPTKKTAQRRALMSMR